MLVLRNIIVLLFYFLCLVQGDKAIFFITLIPQHYYKYNFLST